VLTRRRFRRKDGSLLHAEVSVRALADGCTQGIARDITERIRAEEALRASEAELTALLRAIGDVVLLVGVDGRVERVASWREGFADRSAESVAGATLDAAFGEALASPVRDAMAAALDSRQTVTVEHERGGSSGPVSYEIACSPMPDGRCVVLASDVSALRAAQRELGQLERQLMQAQRLEAIGRLAGGIAHDFNNVLTVIQGHAHLLLHDLHGSEDPHEQLREISEAAGRATQMTRQLLAFSRKQVMSPEPLEINESLRSMESVLRRLVGTDVDIVTEYSSEDCNVLADPGQIDQIVLNLVVNARDAMPEGGRLTLRTSHRELADPAGVAAAGRYVVITVTDTGCGMDEKTQALIFDPFFTTKDSGKGTGLGLATVYGIVRHAGGFIEVDSAPGRGATFRIALPELIEEPEAAGPVATAVVAEVDPLRRLAGRRVLLVEDEVAVRALARRFLERAGALVVTAADGSEALGLADEEAGRIDLLVTDLMLPGANGARVAERFQALSPALPVLFLTGYFSDDFGQLDLDRPGRHLLPKPFTSESLIAAAERTIALGVPSPSA
jgi:signal transduction histidine kinase